MPKMKEAINVRYLRTEIYISYTHCQNKKSAVIRLIYYLIKLHLHPVSRKCVDLYLTHFH